MIMDNESMSTLRNLVINYGLTIEELKKQSSQLVKYIEQLEIENRDLKNQSSELLNYIEQLKKDKKKSK